MKKLLFIRVALVMSQMAMAQQFSLPIMPEKMWPSEYANYEIDVLNCCNYLLTADPAFNQPKHEECTSFLIRWLSGSPEVSVAISADLVDANKSDLLVAYLAAWTRHALQYKDDGALICANVAVKETLRYYETYKSYIGKSKISEKILKQQRKGNLPALVAKTLGI